MARLGPYVRALIGALRKSRLGPPRLRPLPPAPEGSLTMRGAIKDEVVKAYYPQMVNLGQSVRTRAQGGYTIAAAIAAALVTAGAFADVDSRAAPTKALGGLGLLLWLLTVLLYAQAVAGHVMPLETSQPDPDDESSFAGLALHEALYERAVLERRLDRALYTTILAVAATVLAVASALVFSGKSSLEHGELRLTSAGAAALEPICGAETDIILGRFDPSELGEPFVEVALDPQSCPGSKNRKLQIRSRDVATARS